MDKIFTSLILFAITLLFAITFGLSGIPKLLAGGVPDWFTGKFGNCFLASFPGLFLSFYIIALAETLNFLGLVISVVRLEFLADRPKIFLKLSLISSAFTFIMLGFGQRLTHESTGAAYLFFYCGITIFCYFIIDKIEKQNNK